MDSTVKLSRLAASAIGVAIVASSALAIAAPANAATPGVTFVTDADVEASGSAGTVGWSNLGAGPVTSSLSGLSLPEDAELNFGFASALPLSTGSTLVDTGAATVFTASDDADLYAGFYWFATAQPASPRYLYSNNPGASAFTDPSALFEATAAVGTIPAFTPATLGDFDLQFAFDPAMSAATLASAAVYHGGVAVDLYTFTVAGSPFYFTPTPVPSSGPATITAADLGAAGKGFTATTTGFVPNESGDVYLDGPDAGGPVGSFTADDNGAATFTFIAPDANSALGDYTLVLVGGDSQVVQFFDFAVVAPALAATGTDATLPIAAGGIMLLGGVALAIVAAKRRKRA